MNRPSNHIETSCKLPLKVQKNRIPEIRIFSPENEVKGQGHENMHQGQSSTDIACPLIFETCDNNFDIKSYHTLRKSDTENTLECQGHENMGQGHENVGQGHHEPNTSSFLVNPEKNKTFEEKGISLINLQETNQIEYEPSEIECQGQGHNENRSQHNCHSEMETEMIFPFSNDSEFSRQESNHQEQQDMVQLINAACYYVNGKVGFAKGKFLIDTGSSICVLSEKVYERIKGEGVHLQPTQRRVRAANGTLLKIRGTCTLQNKSRKNQIT